MVSLGPAVISRIGSKPGDYYENAYPRSDSLLSDPHRSNCYVRQQCRVGSRPHFRRLEHKLDAKWSAKWSRGHLKERGRSMQPLVSILIPAYNAEKWIRATLESAIGQEYPNKEIIVVNDGSTDRTMEIAKAFQSRFVKIIDQTNHGAPAARNRALEYAQGAYIQWLDHDDLLARHKISAQLRDGEFAKSERLLLSCSFGTFYYRPQKAKFYGGPLCRDLAPIDYFLIKFSGNTYFQTSSWLVSRKLTDLAGPWWEIRSRDDDGEYFCRVVAAAEAIHFVAEAKCFWRIGNYGSLHSAWSKSDAAREASFATTCRCIEHLRKLEDSPRSKAACVKFLQDRLPYFYPESQDIVNRMQALARELGGELLRPPLTWKYKWVQSICNSRASKQVCMACRESKVFAKRNWDRLMYTFPSAVVRHDV